MRLGLVGLGKMGANMSRRLMRHGHTCVVFDLDPVAVEALIQEGAAGCDSLDGLVERLETPRIVWLMLPAGEPTESTVDALAELLEPEDIVIDGGNSYFKDDVQRARRLSARGIHYVDVGTSGGIRGLERGYSLMIGGQREPVNRLEPIFRSLAAGAEEGDELAAGKTASSARLGYLHCGPPGAGHFVKMVHNGIEYGLMQAYAEGFDILRSAGREHVPEAQRYDFDVAEIAEVWRHGSVVGSWLLDLIAEALSEDPHLASFSGFVQDSGEGRWTVTTAIEQAVPVEVISAALYARFRSRQDHTFAERVLSAMRHKFGGHVEPPDRD